MLSSALRERGELVTAATPNATFTNNPDTPPGEVLTGDYQLEIRKSTQYGTAGAVAQTIRSSTVWGIQPGTRQIVQIDPATGIIVGRFTTPDALAPTSSWLACHWLRAVTH